jgi:hypothetical protein
MDIQLILVRGQSYRFNGVKEPYEDPREATLRIETEAGELLARFYPHAVAGWRIHAKEAR